MEKLKIIAVSIAFILLIVVSFVKLPEILHTVIYGIISFFALFFLLVKAKSLGVIKENKE
jgi:hypothetical protein